MNPAGLREATALAAASRLPAEAWRRVLPALLLLLGAIGLFHAGTFVSMERIWSRSDTFAHGYVVAPIALWLIWRRRTDLARQVPAPSPWLLLPLALVALAWLAGRLVNVNSMAQLMATAALVLAVPLVLGLRAAFVILFPLVYLFFAVPIGEFMVPALMQGTADFTVAALRLSGIPVYREGLQFVIPSGNWSVVEACSGVRYLMASFMVGSLFAYLNYVSWRRRLIFALVSLAVPIVANWLRAYMIVMLGHLSGNQLAVGADHLVYGWVFFGVVITILFVIGSRWSELPVDAAPALVDTISPAAPAWRAWAVAGTGALLVALPPLLLNHLDARDGARVAGQSKPVLVAPQSDAWVAQPADPTGWRPAFTPPATELHARYAPAGQPEIGLWVGYYRRQSEDSKLVSSLNQLVTSQDKHWNPIHSGASTVALADGRRLAVRETVLLSGGHGALGVRDRLVAWHFYWIDGDVVADDRLAKITEAWRRLRDHGDDGAAVVAYARSETDEASRRALAAFIRDNFTMLERSLANARGAR